MTGSTHKLGGAAAGLLLIRLGQESQPVGAAILIGSSVLGSLLPDIDNPRSTISCKMPVLRLAVGVVQALTRSMALALPAKARKNIRSMAGHRGLLHAPFTALLFSGILLLAGLGMHSRLVGMAAAGLCAGWASHIALDLFSGGAPLGMPFSSRRTTLARIKTGGVAEWLIRWAALAAISGWAASWFLTGWSR